MSTPTLLNFQQWLDFQPKVLETLEPACDKSNDTERCSSTTAQKTWKFKSLACPSCAAPHFVYKWPPFASAFMNEKLQKVKDLKFCYNCLSNSHLKTDCPPKVGAKKPIVELPITPLATLKSEKTIAMSTKVIPQLTKSQFLANPIYKLTTKMQERQRNFNAPTIRLNPPDSLSSTPPPSKNFPKIFSPIFELSPFPSSMETKRLIHTPWLIPVAPERTS